MYIKSFISQREKNVRETRDYLFKKRSHIYNENPFFSNKYKLLY